MDELNKEQRQAADAVIAGKSLFITGPGGVGKSFLLQVLHEHFERDIKNMAITAMTGCAALLIGPYAKTLHSWAGIGLGRGNPETIIEAIQKDSKKKKRWRQTDVLVIDEVSMLTPALLELLDVVGRRIRKVDRPFGGLQMVYVGDFYQLPPVSKDGPASFAFTSPLWPERRVELTQIIRQKDPAFQKILNEARRGELSAESYAALEARKTMDWKRQEIKPTLLFTKNMDVNAINENKLAKLPGEEHAFKATTTAPARMPAQAVQWAVEKLDRDASYEPVLRLKLGAQVMLLKNVCREDMDEKGKISKTPIQGLVNGSRGVITGFAPDGNPLVKFLSGPPYPVRIVPAAWESDADETEKVTREQIPLRLAYALTIHKAQGASLDSALIDVGPSTFEYGQAYVALSRARSLEALFIYEISAKAFKAHPAVVEFYARPPGIEEEAGAECDVAEVAEPQNNNGKIWSEKEIAALLVGVDAKKTCDEMATERGRTAGAVRSKLQELAAKYLVNDGKAVDEISVLTGLDAGAISYAADKYRARIAATKAKKEVRAAVPILEITDEKPNAFQMMMQSPQTSGKKTKSNYAIIKGGETVGEDSCYLLQFDGLSEPNPGTSTGGAVIFAPVSRKPVYERGEFMDISTNNKAEYTGLIIGLKAATDMGVKHILIEGDSNLVVSQMEGSWKVKNEGLRPLYTEARNLLNGFDFVAIRHVYRSNNTYADRITNDVLRSRKSFAKAIAV